MISVDAIEGHVNGHSFEPGSLEAELEHLSGDDDASRMEPPVSKTDDEAETENPLDEEATEEFIADEVFIEGDEVDEKEEASNEPNTEGDEEDEESQHKKGDD